MALIVCPECGKSVSDTASRCIHCGAPLGELSADENSIDSTQSEKRECYDDLPQAEQDKILEEFYADNPACKKHNKIVNAVNISYRTCIGIGGVGSIVWLIIRCLRAFTDVAFPSFVPILLVPLLIVSLLCWIATVVFVFVIKSLNKKTAVLDVEFKKWLIAEKNLDWSYNPDISVK